jgi:hypothetical protein
VTDLSFRSAMKPARVLAIVVVLAVALATWIRLHFGIDVSDESYYVAMARRFALGDRPLIDEFSPHQSAALLPALFVWLRGRFVPGVEGLVLYTRLLYFGLGLLIWRELHRSLRGPFGAQAALLAGGLFTAFIPFNIPNLSYNTLGCGCFTLGCFIATRATLGSGGRWTLAAAGLAQGLAALAYPTLLLPVLLWWAALAVMTPRGRVGAALVTLAGIALPLAVAALALKKPSPEEWQLFLRGATAIKAGEFPLRKLAVIVITAWESFAWKAVVVPAVVVCVVLARSRWRHRAWCAALLPLLLLPVAIDAAVVHANGYVLGLGLLAPFLMPGFSQPRERVLVATVWLPALIAGMTTAWTSTNGHWNFFVGFFPAAVLTCAYLVAAPSLPARPSKKKEPMPAPVPKGRLLAVVPVLIVLATLVTDQYRSIYRDDPLPRLTARVPAGAFAGLRTTPERAAFLAQLATDLAPLLGDGIFYDSFPAGFLLVPGRPAVNTVWVMAPQENPGLDRDVFLEYWARTRRTPAFAVRMLSIPRSTTETWEPFYPANDPLDAIFTGPGYRLAVSRPTYQVFVRRT